MSDAALLWSVWSVVEVVKVVKVVEVVEVARCKIERVRADTGRLVLEEDDGRLNPFVALFLAWF